MDEIIFARKQNSLASGT